MSSTSLQRTYRLGVGKPRPVMIVLGVIFAGLQVANQVIFTSPSQYQTRDVIAVLLTAFGTVGLSAVYGPQLVAIFHIRKQALVIVGAVLSAATGLLTIVHLSTGLHTVLAAVLTAIGAFVFGAPALTVAVAERPAVYGASGSRV